MKNTLLISVLAMAISFAFVACSHGNTLSQLKGTISIGISSSDDGAPRPAGTAPLPFGTRLEAIYSGAENVSYQWNRDGQPIDPAETDVQYAPEKIGSFSVTVSAEGYASKRSESVMILEEVEGNISIDLSGPVRTGTTLKAVYTGSQTIETEEDVEETPNFIYRWRRWGVSLATGIEYTPTQEGQYTVEVEKTGYISIVSAPIRVERGQGFAIVTFNGLGDEDIDLSRDTNDFISQSLFHSMRVFVSDEGEYDNFVWYIDGERVQNPEDKQDYTESSMILFASNFPLGLHSITVVGTRGDIPYSKRLTFRVVR